MNLLILYFSLAIGISFICSILEAVLLSISMSYVSVLEKEGHKSGKILRILKTDINRSIASILILNTIANTLGAAGVGVQATSVFGHEWLFAVSMILTLAILFFSEIIPKTIGALYWKELAPIAGYFINFFIFITYPIIIFTEMVTNIISRQKDNTEIISKSELLESTLLSEGGGMIDEQESDMIENVLLLDEKKTLDILTPRSVVYAVEKEMTIKEVLIHPKLQTFSRIPVYDRSIDDVIGVVLRKDIFQEALKNQEIKMDELKSEIFKINENIPVAKILGLFIKRKEHIFLVNDGYGQTEGIVTLEDCIETILGVEIMDESDITEDMQKLAKQKMRNNRKK